MDEKLFTMGPQTWDLRVSLLSLGSSNPLDLPRSAMWGWCARRMLTLDGEHDSEPSHNLATSVKRSASHLNRASRLASPLHLMLEGCHSIFGRQGGSESDQRDESTPVGRCAGGPAGWRGQEQVGDR